MNEIGLLIDQLCKEHPTLPREVIADIIIECIAEALSYSFKL